LNCIYKIAETIPNEEEKEMLEIVEEENFEGNSDFDLEDKEFQNLIEWHEEDFEFESKILKS
jgi:hypothetical protein